MEKIEHKKQHQSLYINHKAQDITPHKKYYIYRHAHTSSDVQRATRRPGPKVIVSYSIIIHLFSGKLRNWQS